MILCKRILTAQRFALPALGRGRRSRPARKMTRRVKLLEMCARPAGSPQRQVVSLRADTADRCQVGRSKTVVQQDRRVQYVRSPNS